MTRRRNTFTRNVMIILAFLLAAFDAALGGYVLALYWNLQS